MNNGKALAFVLAIVLPIAACAQTFTGTVRGKNGAALEGASVVAIGSGNKTVSYSITGSEGAYSLTIPPGASPENIHVSYMGYSKKILPFTQLKDQMTITLAQGEFKLKEVKVKALRIRSMGDTLTYSVAGFKGKQDWSIADVIRKMPGLEVKSDGSIEYQGQAINKFYIENLDLMGSQYGVANQNISADKVLSVQVLENHQPVKSLRGISFSEQAALNLVLKDEAKTVWGGCADIGLGYGEDFLYDCRLLGMRFNKKFQALMMYKNNNIGKELGNEVLDLATQLRSTPRQESGILNLMSVASPNLSPGRHTFNHSHLIAGNWLWKTGKDSELRLQGNGFIDRESMQSYHSFTYLTLADLPVITEEQDVKNTRSEWKAEANYQYNGRKTYIKNNIKGYMDFDKSIGTIRYNGERTDLSVRPRKRSITEDFQLSHTSSKGNVYDISSFLAYNYLPGQLLTINGMTEHLNLGFFTMQNAVRHKLKIGRHYLNNEIGFDYDRQNIGVAMDGDAERSQAYQLLQTYWKPSLSFLFGKLQTDASIKLSYAYQSYQESHSHHLWTDPSVSWNWKASVVSEFSAYVSYSNSPLEGKAIYNTPIFTNYHTQRTNRGKTDVQHSAATSVSYKYTNPVIGLFFNIQPLFTWTSGNILYTSNLANDIYTLSATDKEYSMQTWSLTGKISKSFSWAKLFIGLSGLYYMTNYSLLVANEVDDARMRNTNFGLNYSLYPMRFLSVEGKSSVNISHRQNLTHTELSSGSTTNWEHYLSFNIFPADKWMISIRNELLHSNEQSIGTNYFCDVTFSYKTKRWELSLNAANILSTSEFEQRILGNTVETYSITRLRPREFLVKWSFDL